MTTDFRLCTIRSCLLALRFFLACLCMSLFCKDLKAVCSLARHRPVVTLRLSVARNAHARQLWQF